MNCKPSGPIVCVYLRIMTTTSAKPYLRAFGKVFALMMVYDHGADDNAIFIKKGLK